MTDLSAIAEDLKNLPSEVQKTFARLEGMKELTALNAFQMDGQRLDQQQRAIRKEQGLEMPEGEDVAGINNILADNITITDGVKKGVTEPTKVEVAGPSAPSSNGRMNRLATGMLTAAGVLTGANLAWLAGGNDENPWPDRRPVIERESVPLKVEYE